VDVGLLAYQIVVVVEFIKIIGIYIILPICLIGFIAIVLVNFYDFAFNQFDSAHVDNSVKKKETIATKSGAYVLKNKNKRKSRRS
jgi:hypothetical protein